MKTKLLIPQSTFIASQIQRVAELSHIDTMTSHLRGTLSGAAATPHGKESVEFGWVSDEDGSWTLPSQGVFGIDYWRRTVQDRHKTRRTDYVFQLTWDQLNGPLNEIQDD